MPQLWTFSEPLVHFRPMFVRSKKKSESKWQIQIVESIRVDGKTRQKILRNVATARSEKERLDFIELAESIAVEMRNKRQPVLGFADPKEIHKSRKRSEDPIKVSSLEVEKQVCDGFETVMKPIFKELEITTGDTKTDDTICALTMARAFKPSSKLAAHKYLKKHLDVDIPLHDIYRSLDKLADKEEPIKKAICNKTLDLFNRKVDIMFFDVTTLSFESQKSDELREFGFSKDCKFNEVQVVLALVTSKEGLPITYQLFPGNKYEGHTLIPVINELKKQFSIDKIFLAADRGMFNKDNLEEMDKQGIKYVVGAKLKTMKKQIKNEILYEDDAKPAIVCEDLHWIKEIHLDSRKLIVGFNVKRARKDASDRQRLIDRLLKKAKDGKIDSKKIVGNRGTAKYIKEVEKSQYEVDLEKIESDQAWDGIYGVITNSELSSNEVLSRYRGLWQIEEAFRVNKHDLKMRPIFHWTSKRIKAHILLCYITYAMIKYLNFQIEKAGHRFSPKAFLEALTDIQSTILENKFSKKRYSIPSKLTPEAAIVLDALKIKRKASATALN